MPLQSGDFTTDRIIRRRPGVSDSAMVSATIYNAAAVSKLGLWGRSIVRFHLPGTAETTRLPRNMSTACATDPTVLERQLSETRC